MNAIISHPAPAAHHVGEVVVAEVAGAERLLGRSRAELADAMTWLAWYAPGTYTAVMDYMDWVDGEPRAGR